MYTLLVLTILNIPERFRDVHSARPEHPDLSNPERFRVVEQLLAQTGSHLLDSALAFPQYFSYHRVATRRPLRLF